ncbi:MAG TPA: hypothetical protein VGL65_04330 [Gemmatimonadales bacterium]|jgi:hypothetical protein
MFIAILRLGIIGTLLAPRNTAIRPGPGCLTRDGSEETMVLNQRMSLRSGHNAKVFALTGLTRSDTNQIGAVTIDSLCDLAAQTINRALHRPDKEDEGIHMITLGKFYWVIPRYKGRTEFPPSWLLDSTLTSVVYRTPSS